MAGTTKDETQANPEAIAGGGLGGGGGMTGATLDYAEGWNPSEGDVLIGTITDLGLGWSDWRGGNYPIVTIQPDRDGAGNELAPVALHCFHHSLFARVTALRPIVGERIGVKFKGKSKTKDGKRTVAQYVVRIEGRSAEDQQGFWDRMPNVNAVPAEATAAAAAAGDSEPDLPF